MAGRHPQAYETTEGARPGKTAHMGGGPRYRIKQNNRLRLNCELRNHSLYRGFRNLSPTGC
jgi:hypothetical protein